MHYSFPNVISLLFVLAYKKNKKIDKIIQVVLEQI